LDEDFLFYGKSLSQLIFAYPQMLASEIEKTDRNTILNASLSDLTDHFVAKFICDIPRLQVDQAHQLDPQDVAIDVSYDISRSFRDSGADLPPEKSSA